MPPPIFCFVAGSREARSTSKLSFMAMTTLTATLSRNGKMQNNIKADKQWNSEPMKIYALDWCAWEITHCTQLVKDTFIHAAFLEVQSGSIDNISDDLRIDLTDARVRHIGA
jgi:hypothetical protein